MSRHAEDRQVRVVMTREKWDGRDMAYVHDDTASATVQRAWFGSSPNRITVRGLGLQMHAKRESDGSFYCYRGHGRRRHRYRFTVEAGPL